MNESETTRRTDAELILILNDAAAWVVRDERGASMGRTTSLRAALCVASAFRRAGHETIALTQEQNDRIIVFGGQMERLRAAMGDC